MSLKKGNSLLRISLIPWKMGETKNYFIFENSYMAWKKHRFEMSDIGTFKVSYRLFNLFCSFSFFLITD